MEMFRRLALGATLLLASLGGAMAQSPADTFPSQLVRIIVPFSAGSVGGVTRTTGIEATCVTPTKSFTGSNARPLLSTPRTVCPFEVSISVWPSGAALAAVAVPAMPGRFSTMTC